ncbi:hypothetical protein LTR66_015913, partial [Elasticomyces elasticus]
TRPTPPKRPKQSKPSIKMPYDPSKYPMISGKSHYSDNGGWGDDKDFQDFANDSSFNPRDINDKPILNNTESILRYSDKQTKKDAEKKNKN